MNEAEKCKPDMASEDDSAAPDWELRLKLHQEARTDLLNRQISNRENADKAVLSVSTASLGFSLAFLKDVVPFAQAESTILIYASWFLFSVAIISILISFFSGQKAIAAQLELANQYYLEYKDAALDTKPLFASITEWLNRLGAVCFVLGLIATCAYVFINVNQEALMSDKINTSHRERTPITNGQKVTNAPATQQKGLTGPSLQSVPLKPKGGVTGPTLQQVPIKPPKKEK